MFTKIRKAPGAVQLAAVVGLFSMTAVGAWAGEICATAPAYESGSHGPARSDSADDSARRRGYMVVEAMPCAKSRSSVR